MHALNLSGHRVLIAGIADDRGFGFAIARNLAAHGARVCAATWPPAYKGFRANLDRGRLQDSMRLPDGSTFQFEAIYPLDARFDTAEEVPAEVRENRRYREFTGYAIADLALRLESDFGPKPIDSVIHCIANGREVSSPLLDTSRAGYLDAISTSTYSFVALARRLRHLLRENASLLCLSFIGAERVIPGYGGGMSSAKAALESDVRVLAFEMGRNHGVRVNCISAGPWPSRAAGALGFIEHMAELVARNSPIPKPITPDDVASVATFLCSPMARALTGCTVHVDNGSHCMGIGFTAAEAARAEKP